MTRRNIFPIVMAASLITISSFTNAQPGANAQASIDLAGNWAPDLNTDENSNAPDEPLPGSWYGIPLNAAGRAQALMYSASQLDEPALLCDYTPAYIMLGPFGLRIFNRTESNDGTTVAWVVGGWRDTAPITIWMDGRAEPSEYAPHPKSGFATGTWENGVLKAYITHMQAGQSKRNGAPLSDEAVVTLWFMRHADELTVLSRMYDPVFLSEPFMMTRDFVNVVTRPEKTVGPPCIPAFAGVSMDQAEYYLPEQNSTIKMTPETYGIPAQAMLAGAPSMYPEFRNTLKSKYKRPAECKDELKYQTFPNAVCGGPGKYQRRAPVN